MPTETVKFNDAIITIHASWSGDVKIDVTCDGVNLGLGLTTQQFAQMVYPAIKAAASAT